MIFLTIHDIMLAPFVENPFLRRALVGCMALALGAGPTGVFLILRRMSLIGDTLAHSILPGAAAGFLIFGLSIPAMSLGGFIAGAFVALVSGFISRTTALKEDASLAGFFLIAMASGVILVSKHGNMMDLMHVLFGSILAIDDNSLIMMAMIGTFSLSIFAVIYRGLIADCLDPGFLRASNGNGGAFHTIFLLLVVANMVCGFQALGSLMSVGLMILPATAARFWTREVWSMICLATIIACCASYTGLLLSFYLDLPSGPSIILTAGTMHVFSLTAGTYDSLLARYLRRRHLRR